MEGLIEKDLGRTFAYRSIAEQNRNLAVLRIRDHVISHEFNYVFLKNSRASELILQLAPNVTIEAG